MGFKKIMESLFHISTTNYKFTITRFISNVPFFNITHMWLVNAYKILSEPGLDAKIILIDAFACYLQSITTEFNCSKLCPELICLIHLFEISILSNLCNLLS